MKINKLFQSRIVSSWELFQYKGRDSNGQIWVAGKLTNLGVRGTRCGAFLGGDEIRWYQG